jgi:hypothetical protein
MVLLLPCVVAVVLAATDALLLTRRTAVVVSVGLALMGAFSVAATRDYLEHHRSRSALLQPLLDKGAAPNAIEGGFEFDGRYKFQGLGKPQRPGEHDLLKFANYVFEATNEALRTEAHCRWQKGDRYLLSFCPSVNGYHSIAEHSFQRLLPWSVETLYMHEIDQAAKR